MSLSLQRLALAAGAALLAASKLWAGLTGDLAATMAGAGDDPWGIVALVALYGGLAAAAGLVLMLEPRRTVAAAVLVAMPLIGNMAPALWMVWRGLALISSRAGR